MTDMVDVSRILGMNVTRDREEGTIHDQSGGCGAATPRTP